MDHYEYTNADREALKRQYRKKWADEEWELQRQLWEKRERERRMKLYIYDGPDGIFWSKYPPSAQSPLVLGTIEVQEPGERLQIFDELCLKSELKQVDDLLARLEIERFGSTFRTNRRIERILGLTSAPKKTVVKEIPLQLVPPTPRTLDSDGNVRHSIAVGLPPKAFNIKLIYEDEQ
jgi:hypothetical protein